MKLARTPEQTQTTGKRLIIALTVFTAVVALSPGAKLLIPLFPLLSLGLALYLVDRQPGMYVSFVCWMFFLTPLVRRLVEYHMHSASATFLMSAAQVVPIAGLYAYRHRWSDLLDLRLRPWLLVGGVLIYGILLGVLTHGVGQVLPDLLGWVSPIGFSLYILKKRDHLEEMIASFRLAFLVGVAVMGIYGVYQYFYLAPWDAFWMEQNPFLSSIGLPRPQEVRVFSTMNTPQPLADNLVAGILFGFVSRRPIRLITVSAGLLALALSLARSAWLVGVLALIYLAWELTPRQRLRMVLPTAVCVLALAAVLVTPQLQDTLNKRVQSFTDLKQDDSVNERLATQAAVTDLFFSTPFGLGMGASAQASSGPTFGIIQPGFNLTDNGIQEVMLTFGWFGTLVFAAGFSEGLVSAFFSGKDTNLLVLKALILCIVLQAPALAIFLGATGFLLWGAIAFCIASKWVRSEQQVSVDQPEFGFAGTTGVVL